MLLSKGILLNNGKTWLSVNNIGESCELISATEFSSPESYEKICTPKSRFSEAIHFTSTNSFTVKVRTRYLSPGVTYSIRLVFQYLNRQTITETLFIDVKYKHATTEKWNVHRANLREDGWFMTELYQFTSHRKKVGFEFSIEFTTTIGFSQPRIVLEGIEFQPVEKETVEDTVEDFSAMDMLLLSDSNTDWEQKLPNDYLNIIKRSKDEVAYASKKEIYLLLSKGILVKQERNLFLNLCCWFWEPEPECQWFSIDRNGGRCLLLPSKLVFREPESEYAGHRTLTWEPFVISRFPIIARVSNYNMDESLQIRCEIDCGMLSPRTRYAAYLVYLKPGKDRFDSLLFIKTRNNIDRLLKVVYLMDVQTPVIGLEHDQWSQQGLSTTKRKGDQRRRRDGWMEVKVWEFTTGFDASENVYMDLELSNNCWCRFQGLMVEGIEFRPV